MSPSPLACGSVAGTESAKSIPSRRAHAGAFHDAARHLPRVEPLALELEPAGVERRLAREQDVVDDVREPVGLLGNEVEQPLALWLLQAVEAALQGERRAVDRRERRAQLVRDGGDEVGLRLVEPLVLADVAERVDDAVRERDARSGEPQLAALDLERDGRRRAFAVALCRVAHGDLTHGDPPAGDRRVCAHSEHAIRR